MTPRARRSQSCWAASPYTWKSGGSRCLLSWYLSVADLEDAPIASGRQMAPLVRLVRSTAFAGEIVAIPRRAEDQGDIGRQGWQATHDLTYFTAAETALVDWP